MNLLSSSVVRRLADRGLLWYARRRVAEIDRLDVYRTQEAILRRLLQRGANTAFGREHGFDRIRDVADYQARVPLRDYEAYWEQYWRRPFPHLAGVSWPDFIPYFGLSSGTTSGSTKYLPLSRALLKANTRAALTTLSWFVAAHPHTPLFTGRLFFLGGSTDLVPLGSHRRHGRILGGDLSGVTAIEASSWMRPFTFPPVELALLKDWEQKMATLAQEAAALPITMLSGVPSWMLVLFDRLRQVTGKEKIAEIWPTLRLVIHGGTKFDPYRDLFREQIGSDAVRYTEVYPASEAYIAALDPRYDRLRLIVDADIFYEFVPVEDLESARPRRHTVAEVELGVNYAVVLTNCAGLWSYVLGDTVAFESRNPPLLRFTGRTKYFLSAFGEHLISEEVEKAVAEASRQLGSAAVDFHVGPLFPASAREPGRHLYLVEFAGPTPDLERFGAEVDGVLRRLNEDYDAHRQGDLTMLGPRIVAVPRGGFTEWMRSKGKLGGQHKVPRMDNSGALTGEMARFFENLGAGQSGQ
ncbi:MAG: GH3 auxin-responsive promoter family protein [Gemmataceae bacterium]